MLARIQTVSFRIVSSFPLHLSLTHTRALPLFSSLPLHVHIPQTSYFENFIMLTIFINAIIIAVETSSAPGSNGDFFVVADIIFLVIYTIEFALKVFCEPRDYWASNYNRFDFLILFLSFFSFMQLIMKSDSGIFSNLAYIRVLRGRKLRFRARVCVCVCRGHVCQKDVYSS